jgi:glyoxylase-like metal-dependent hydrolase (beta-lactamase superfamily II)
MVGGSDSHTEDWTVPGAFEVCAGVHRIPLPLPLDGLRAVNVYAIADGDGVVMVDGGWALEESQALLARSLDKIGYGLADITDFLVTHAHRDHYTQAVAVRQLFGSRVSLSEDERPNLAALSSLAPTGDLAQYQLLEEAGAPALADELRRLRAARTSDRSNWEMPDRWLSDRTKLNLASRSLESIHTPGHTRGHQVFLDENAALLFAGDHVLPHITPSLGFEQAPVRSPLADYLTSLVLLRRMPDAQLLPAHGPTGDSVHDRVDQLLMHHEARLVESLSAVDSGADTAHQIAAMMGWTRHRRKLKELDPFNAMLAILETAAHLDVLAERGLLMRVEEDATVHYTR